MSYSVRFRCISSKGFLSEAVARFVHDAKSLRLDVKGPLPMPRKTTTLVYNRSVHVNNRSKEKFRIVRRDRLVKIDVKTPEDVARADGLCRYWVDNAPVESVGMTIQRRLPLGFRAQRTLDIHGVLKELIPCPASPEEQRADQDGVY